MTTQKPGTHSIFLSLLHHSSSYSFPSIICILKNDLADARLKQPYRERTKIPKELIRCTRKYDPTIVYTRHCHQLASHSSTTHSPSYRNRIVHSLYKKHILIGRRRSFCKYNPLPRLPPNYTTKAREPKYQETSLALIDNHIVGILSPNNLAP